MAHYHKNEKEPGVPPWVCAICGIPEDIGCKHKNLSYYSLIRESGWRKVLKMVERTKLNFVGNIKGEPR